MSSPLLCTVAKTPTSVTSMKTDAVMLQAKPAIHGAFMVSIKRPKSIGELLPLAGVPSGVETMFGCKFRSVASVVLDAAHHRTKTMWGFRIQPTTMNGDCFFDSLSIATMGTSNPLTISMLKHILADATIGRSAATQVQDFVMERLRKVKSAKDATRLMKDLRQGCALATTTTSCPKFFADTFLTAMRVSADGGVAASEEAFLSSGLRLSQWAAKDNAAHKDALQKYVDGFKRRGGIWVQPSDVSRERAAAKSRTLDPYTRGPSSSKPGLTGMEQYYGTWREMQNGSLPQAWLALRQDIDAPFYATDREIGLLGDALNIAFIVIESDPNLDITVRFPDAVDVRSVRFVALYHTSGGRGAQWGAHFELVEFCPLLADIAESKESSIAETMWSWASLPKALQIAVLTKSGTRAIEQHLTLHKPDRKEFVSNAKALRLPRSLVSEILA